MLSPRFLLGVKVVLGLLPIFYGVTLIVALPNTWRWLTILGLALLALLVFCFSLDFPLQTVWPVFPGAFLILAGAIVVYQGGTSTFSSTSQPLLLLALFGIAALYIAWAARATWKAYSVY